MSNTLQSQKIKDLIFMEQQNGNPSFVWKGNNYIFVPSITDFNRDPSKGGFAIVKLMTATIRKFDLADDDDETLLDLFNGVYPEPQKDVIKYSVDGKFYRVESIKHDTTNAYFRLVAHSTNKF